MTYKLTTSSTILRIADSASIPPDERNAEYRDYLAWLADGNTPEPADVPPPPNKATRIAQALGEYTRTEVHAVIALAQLNAKVEFMMNSTPIATSMATALAKNSSYRTAVEKETACRVIEKEPV